VNLVSNSPWAFSMLDFNGEVEPTHIGSGISLIIV
jgi:hypothetical protein